MGQSSTNVFERISAEYYNLTPAEKKAADYVLSHQRKTQDMSITELAAASGVAEATVSRFCRRLEERFLRRRQARPDALLAELRTFYRLGRHAKLRHAELWR